MLWLCDRSPRYFIKAIRQIDERYGQFGSDADLAAEIRRASRKILLVPAARVRHQGRSAYSAMERADFLSSRAVFLGKYQGLLAGLRARTPALLRTAYLLTGNQHSAEDLVQAALERAAAAWWRVRREASAEAYVRQVMYRLQVSHWRRASLG